jgi:hypothetical protein
MIKNEHKGLFKTCALSSLTSDWFQTLALAFSKPMLCIFWGAILKMSGYMTGMVRWVGGNARGIPRTPTNGKNKNEKILKKY